ncbi:hypothetical protein FA95DRAFT_1665351 [Auriscalpium vulgare]|uniref:Uncharacterized protein n=1 Tax=Auriscalpium vulgare TaxID=40419 RepID=A0ACB8RSY4_9AGAM|nr:hypothetical protein FA95DRAFT_1665351 [Auriscalpium vulgare]
MLYRFREAQAAELGRQELGLGTRSDRCPRMTSACKSFRECERWRGEILPGISRKVSEIQDGASALMREKRHWGTEIVALGGANNAGRNVVMLDDDGWEVPGTKGYKYFGRAKELPGVKELSESRKKKEDEETATQNFYNQGPCISWPRAKAQPPPSALPTSDQPQPPPTRNEKLRAVMPRRLHRHIPLAKRAKTDGFASASALDSAADLIAFHARAAAAYIAFLEPGSLMPLKLPTKEETESVSLDPRKRALVVEYFGN